MKYTYLLIFNTAIQNTKIEVQLRYYYLHSQVRPPPPRVPRAKKGVHDDGGGKWANGCLAIICG